MSDGEKARAQEIEKRIDREVTSQMSFAGAAGGARVMAPANVTELLEFAKLMSVSGVCVRPTFRGNPGACLAIAVQAMKWGADPFAVANKAYVVKNRAGEETIAYEAQLIHAIVNASPVLLRRLRPVYEGQGQERRCRIVGWVKGESEPLEYESPPVRAIAVKNSPLWQGDPDQQLFYYSTRAWARRHVPEILLGIYAQEEFQGDTVEHEPEPQPRREEYSIPAQRVEPAGPEFAVVDLDGVENIYGSAGAAAEVLRICLDEAARLGAQRLAGWWESNESAIEFLAAAGYGDLAAELTAHYENSRKPADRPIPSGRHPAAQPAPARAEPDRGASQPLVPRRARQAQRSEAPATEAPAEEQAPHAPPAGDSDPFDHRMPPTEEPPPVELRGPPGAVGPDRRDTAAEIVVPLKGGKRDYRTWALALLGPKVRRCGSSNELAELLGANERNLEEARTAGAMTAADRAEMERIIAEQWQKLPA